MDEKDFEILNNMIADRPQRLCKMCGKCCRIATTEKTYPELLEACEKGDSSAMDFLSIFEPYPSIEAAREVDAPTVDNIISTLKKFSKYDESRLYFYHCKYIQDNNLCGHYEKRPFVCKFAPSSAWTVFPPDCGFNGWLFQKQEEKKEMVRRSKETILTLEAMLKDLKNPEQLEKITHAIETSKKIVAMFERFGSADW